MLIHDHFRKDLVIHSNESRTHWDEYGYDYLVKMKRYVKQQLIEQIGSIHGLQIMIDRPIALHKQIPLIMAIWELGGSIIVNDLHYTLQQNPIYQDFYSSIDICLVEHGDIQYSQIDKQLVVFKNRIHEIKYWDQDELFNSITDDPIVATETDTALTVATSGTNRAPQQISYTHAQLRLAVDANLVNYDYRSDEHVFHLKSFHHGGLSVNYFLPTLEACQHHYFGIDHNGIDVIDHALNMINSTPVTRVMLPYAVSDKFINGLPTNRNLVLQTTHNFESAEQLDQLFDHNKVSRIFVLFGCRELPSAIFIQDIDTESWMYQREHWKSNIYDLGASNFWELNIFNEGLGVKASYMSDYYIPGDIFTKLNNNQWQWQGRNTVIKREGHVVNPDAVATVLDSCFLDLDKVIVPDYEFKKLYAFVFGTNSSNLAEQFNTVIDKEIDVYHRLDLVMCLDKKDMIGQGRSTLSVLRFLARQELKLS